MNEVSARDVEPRTHVHDDGVSNALKVILTTRAARYITITIWAIMLLALAKPLIVVLWYCLTMTAGAGRSIIEKRIRDSEAGKAGSHHRRYALVAMASCSFWAAAPIIAAFSGHPFGVAGAIFLITNGFMLAFSQFRTAPTNAMIVTSPYAFAYGVCLAATVGSSAFPLLLAGVPVLVASISYVLMFGYLSQQELNRANMERETLIEELEAARIAAEKASEAKSMFLANMSHEIRTPMNGVLGMAELLAHTRLDNRQRLFAETIHKSGAALLTIINDILDFSKIEAGRLDLETAPFDLRASIEDIAALMTARAQEKQIELIVRFQPDLPQQLVGDGGRIRQVITNLVANAVKFTDQGYVLINVSGAHSGETARLRIEIEDTGVGIEEGKIDRIFDAFQQADSSTTRKFGGTGLGLSISKRLVEAMGGKLGAASRLGEGSVFSIELALPIHKSEEIAEPSIFDADGVRVLVVDDIGVNRRILLEQLGAWGFRPDAAPNAAEALGMLRDAHAAGAPFKLAILDYFMPETDGLDLARQIRADESLRDIPLMVLTSVDRPGDSRRFREVGVDGYLIKPARAALLFETIVNILCADKSAGGVGETDGVVESFSPTAPAPAPPQEKTRILLAEDNDVNQLVIKHLLDSNAHELVIANNGREALERFESEPDGFDIILMDVSMPEMDGYEAARAIRALEADAGREPTPIVCLTAHVLAGDVEKSEEAGMDDYLSKPVGKEKLDSIIRRWTREEGRGERRGESRATA